MGNRCKMNRWENINFFSPVTLLSDENKVFIGAVAMNQVCSGKNFLRSLSTTNSVGLEDLRCFQ